MNAGKKGGVELRAEQHCQRQHLIPPRLQALLTRVPSRYDEFGTNTTKQGRIMIPLEMAVSGDIRHIIGTELINTFIGSCVPSQNQGVLLCAALRDHKDTFQAQL